MKNIIKHIASLVLVLSIVVVPQLTFAAITNGQGGFDVSGIKTDAGDFGISTATPTDILTNIINYALALIGFLGVLGFIISGIMYLVSAGDEGAAEKAKGYMVNSIIGVIIALLGYVVIAAISTLLGSGGATNGL